MQTSKFHRAVWLAVAIFMMSGGWAGADSVLFTRVPVSSVNTGHVEQAYRLMDSLYAKWQNGTFEPVGDEFTAEMQQGLSPELQKQSFEQVRAIFGDYQGMTFVEALTARFLLPRGTVYRFKGKYSKTSENPEIRVVFDSDGKISGLWLKPWTDEMQ